MRAPLDILRPNLRCTDNVLSRQSRILPALPGHQQSTPSVAFIPLVWRLSHASISLSLAFLVALSFLLRFFRPSLGSRLPKLSRCHRNNPYRHHTLILSPLGPLPEKGTCFRSEYPEDHWVAQQVESTCAASVNA